MLQNVVLEDGETVNVHTRIKDLCKCARNRKGLTNTDIAELICRRFGLEDFSVNTVNNFFSERSKATTVYTTGCICAVLDISIDAAFGIQNELNSEEENEFIRQFSEIKVELRFREQEIANLKVHIAEKDEMLNQVHETLEYYRQQTERNRFKVQPWVFVFTLSALIITLLLVIIYLVRFDLGNPAYGIFK